ncbi:MULTISPECIES: iron ABC transporter substrate-binding protein [Dietzia]|jgi:iron(III) transport system substrate-binding protein|uniref:Iron ABC transporter substrate-binding protein n=1 Tax=Dietzia maris TaxID=37915 RepID=A0ABT8H2S8_9ACTN|nr:MULTISPECIES: iron ABC transporter substrate-binding protein [Dietzia]MBB0992911.1 iron ABC transporter substrate-binding protein [Dietzia sp. SLG510A3-40A3]MBB0997240.1 iron ABC transporter substrate-binding protein [Dietzia maris]MBB1018766.1 iron ABC transporter substrate-binding protein [Dietzia sp. DQ11-71]MCZ4539553.1 iron ABC transporter substrate-binding protein [Dietzia maris]MDJ0423258.1 iron ABC transporter substrate-binding protein [Dietzia kunjamensis]
MKLRRVAALAAAGSLVLGLAACTSDSDESDALVLYSGRSESLVAPLIEQISDSTGVDIEVRYASTPEMAAQIAEEGEASPADVFFSQDAGALGALDNAGLLQQLDESVTEAVPAEYRAADGTWVATSLRARVLIYDSRTLDEAEVPDTIDAVLAPEWKGRVGYAPTNASFQSFVTALRVDRGDEAAEQWLRDFLANDPQTFENNNALLQAVDAGTVELGLTNHYYWYNSAAEKGAENMRARVKYMAQGDPGALVNVAGVAILASTDRPDDARRVVEAFLAEPAQTYFVEETSEYPVVPGIATDAAGLPPLDTLGGPDIDLGQLDGLEQTQAMLARVGMI